MDPKSLPASLIRYMPLHERKKLGFVEPEVVKAKRDNKLEKELHELVMTIRPPDVGRDAWIKIGMGIHHQTYGSDIGLEIWENYSNQGYENPEVYGSPASWSELEYQWHSFII